MSTIVDKYLEELTRAYEAEKREDYAARRYHINKASMIIQSMNVQN